VTTRFDTWTKQLGDDVPRRKVILGLGGLTLSSLGMLAAREATSAADVGIEGCHRRCRRRCENRKPRCKENCVKRLCQR
jgi:hypothetical protein